MAFVEWPFTIFVTVPPVVPATSVVSEYIKTLVDNGIAISMSRKGVPQDNAYAESFMKTLKYEEVYMTEYANIAEARHQIAHFVEEVYNKKRLHSAIGYLPPAEFESVGYNKAKVAP